MMGLLSQTDRQITHNIVGAKSICRGAVLFIKFFCVICVVGCVQTQTKYSQTEQKAQFTSPGTPTAEQSASTYGGRFTFAGEPVTSGYPNPVQRLLNTAFLVAYDDTRKNPAWAAYRIPSERKYGPLPRPRRFVTDNRTQARISHDSYTGTGYDRGHMVPNFAIASRFGKVAQSETFLMSNIAPQKPALNQGPWRLLELTLSEITAIHSSEIWVIVGPVYDGEIKEIANGPAIPSGYFLLVADDTPSGPRLQAFLLPQLVSKSDDYRNFRTTVQTVQQKTGFDFFCELPDKLEQKLEQEFTSYWLEN